MRSLVTHLIGDIFADQIVDELQAILHDDTTFVESLCMNDRQEDFEGGFKSYDLLYLLVGFCEIQQQQQCL